MKDFRNAWREKHMSCRIGTTSYIIPADILPNLKFLSGIVDDVELVLFESDEFSNLPAKSDVREMKTIADDSGLSFTVHLPLDAWPGASDENERERSVQKWLRVIDLMSPLSPFGWVVHLNDPPKIAPGPENPRAWDNWISQCSKTIDTLTGHADPEMLCIETLSYDYSRVFPLVVEKQCSICVDIGHLLLTNRDIAASLDAWFDRTRIIHLHGVNDKGRDHVDISHIKSDLLADLIQRLNPALEAKENMERVLTLEIFSLEDLEISMSVLRKTL